MGSNMKTLAKEIARWGVIAATGGYGVYLLIGAGRILAWRRGDATYVFAIVMSFMFLVFAAPFLATAYFCLRRQYRKIFLVVGAVGCMVIFFGLSALPEQLGLFKFMAHHLVENHDLAFLGLPICLLLLFGPIYAAAWFCRLCGYLAYPGRAKRPKTRATRGLVWLGVLCMVLPPLISMLVTFNQFVQSPHARIAADSIDESLRWIIGGPLIGVLLVFLGLIRRRPVVEAGDNALPAEQ